MSRGYLTSMARLTRCSSPKTDSPENPEDLHLLDLFTRMTQGMLMMNWTAGCLMGESSELSGPGRMGGMRGEQLGGAETGQ